MTPADLAALHRACIAVPPPWPEAAFRGLSADPLCFLLTEPGGFLVGRAVAGEAELLTLAVAPGARRRGIGARLVQRFLDQARRRGAARAFLEVAADNAPATALYVRAGFALTGLRRAYYRTPDGRPVDALAMARDLGP